jgi:CHAD domain-containing protein
MATARPIEVELKYRVTDPAAAERLLGEAGLDGWLPVAAVRTSQVEDRYVDTADGSLARAGFAVRLRHGSGGTMVGVKSLSARRHDALHEREELEGPADAAFPPHDWPASSARSLVLELAGDAPLVELVTIRQLRHIRSFRSAETTVELSLDEVDVVARGRIVDHFTELEAELREGTVADLERLAATLSPLPGLEPSPASKLEVALMAIGSARGPSGNGGGGPQRPASRSRASLTATTAPPAGGRSTDGPSAATAVLPDVSAEVVVASSESEGADAGGPEEPRLGDDAVTAPEARAGDLAPDGGHGHEHPPGDEANDVSTSPGSTSPESASPGSPSPEPVSPNGAEPASPTAPGETTDDAATAAEPAETSRLVVGRTPGVRAEDTLAEAGRRILRFHLAKMLAKEAGTRAGKDPEELHSMRVATRRMRAAWRVYGDAYRPRRERRYVRDLREIAGRLGAVRDLDVLIEELEGYVEHVPEREGRHLAPLVDAWRRQREDARALLLRTLDGDAYRRFVDEYREFVRTDGLGVLAFGPAEPHRVRDRMPSRILDAYEHVRAYEPILRWADVETLHALRIAAKRLRYTIEFAREPMGPEAAPLIERVVALQDHLGYLHDADVAAGLARQFLVDRAAELSEAETAAIGRFLVERERERARLRRTVWGPWRRVAGLAFRRALGRAIAGI